MKHTKYLITLAFLLCLFFPKATYAYKVGNVEVKVRSSLTEAYDDNITYASTNKKSDIVTNLRAGIDTAYDGKTDSFRLTANLTRHQYAQNHIFSNTGEDSTASYQKELSKYDRLSFTNDFAHAEEPSSFEDQFGRTTGRYGYYRNTFGAGYTRDITKQFSASVNYNNSINHYTRKDLTDSNFNLASLIGNYALNSQTVVSGVYEYFQREFEHAGTVKTNRLAAGLRQYFTNQFYFDGQLGEDFIRTIDKQDETGQFISASLTDEVDQATVLRLTYTKEDSSTVYSQDLFKSQRVSISAGKQLFPRLSGSLSAFYGTGDYALSNTRSKLSGINAGLTYDLLDKLRANLAYNYSKNTSNVPTNAYTRNYISLGMTYEF